MVRHDYITLASSHHSSPYPHSDRLASLSLDGLIPLFLSGYQSKEGLSLSLSRAFRLYYTLPPRRAPNLESNSHTLAPRQRSRNPNASSSWHSIATSAPDETVQLSSALVSLSRQKHHIPDFCLLPAAWTDSAIAALIIISRSPIEEEGSRILLPWCVRLFADQSTHRLFLHLANIVNTSKATTAITPAPQKTAILRLEQVPVLEQSLGSVSQQRIRLEKGRDMTVQALA